MVKQVKSEKISVHCYNIAFLFCSFVFTAAAAASAVAFTESIY